MANQPVLEAMDMENTAMAVMDTVVMDTENMAVTDITANMAELKKNR